MPCCGLSEHKVRVPLRYTLIGISIFWGGFSALLAVGLLLSWLPFGRRILVNQWAFIMAIWRDCLEDPASGPRRWACRFSGLVLRYSPRGAAWIARRPDVLMAAGASVGLGTLVGGVLWVS